MAKTNTTDQGTVTGVFHSHAEAQKAVRDLKAAGFTDDQIGVVSRHEDAAVARTGDSDETMAEEGAAIGAATGLGAGALWGLGIVAGVLPAIGPVIAGGALAAIAASAAGTAVAGGLVGALIGLGVPEEEAEYYHSEFERGRTIVTVRAGAKSAEARRILDQTNAYDYARRDSEYASNPRAANRIDMDGKLVARKEVADVDKHNRATEARVRKEVHTDSKHVEVPVKREELVVERTPLNNRETGAIRGGARNEEERIVLNQEEVDVNKRTVGKEAVKVGKRTVSDTATADVDLKEEDIVVEGETKQTRSNRPR